jgi:hypothetical protein
MSIASRIRWRRRFALLVPHFAIPTSRVPGMPTQRHLVVLWFGIGMQITISRMPHWMRM